MKVVIILQGNVKGWIDPIILTSSTLAIGHGRRGCRRNDSANGVSVDGSRLVNSHRRRLYISPYQDNYITITKWTFLNNKKYYRNYIIRTFIWLLRIKPLATLMVSITIDQQQENKKLIFISIVEFRMLTDSKWMCHLPIYFNLYVGRWPCRIARAVYNDFWRKRNQFLIWYAHQQSSTSSLNHRKRVYSTSLYGHLSSSCYK